MSRFLLILLIFTSFKTYSSSVFVPDGDTALLIQILGAEIEATVGILKIAEVSSKTVNKIAEVHSKIRDMHTRGMQAEYYAKTLLEFSKTKKSMHSMVDLKNHLYDAKALYDNRKTLTFGYDLLKLSSDIASSRAADSTKQSSYDQKLAMRYLQESFVAGKTAEGAVLGARASALSAVQLSSVNNSLSSLTDHANTESIFRYLKEVERLKDEYRKQIRWGMISKDMPFSTFSGIKFDYKGGKI